MDMKVAQTMEDKTKSLIFKKEENKLARNER